MPEEMHVLPGVMVTVSGDPLVLFIVRTDVPVLQTVEILSVFERSRELSREVITTEDPVGIVKTKFVLFTTRLSNVVAEEREYVEVSEGSTSVTLLSVTVTFAAKATGAIIILTPNAIVLIEKNFKIFGTFIGIDYFQLSLLCRKNKNL